MNYFVGGDRKLEHQRFTYTTPTPAARQPRKSTWGRIWAITTQRIMRHTFPAVQQFSHSARCDTSPDALMFIYDISLAVLHAWMPGSRHPRHGKCSLMALPIMRFTQTQSPGLLTLLCNLSMIRYRCAPSAAPRRSPTPHSPLVSLILTT